MTAYADITAKPAYIQTGALVTVLSSDRAMKLQPDGPAILLRNGSFIRSHVVGTENVFADPGYAVYAIYYNRPAALKLLLEYGTPWSIPIGDMQFDDMLWGERMQRYTLLTWAVELGQIVCVDALLKYANDPASGIIRPDGLGQSALTLALSAVAATHPRDPFFNEGARISELQDTSVLALLQNALQAEHDEFISAPERVDMVRTAGNDAQVRHRDCSRFQLVAGFANSFLFSPVFTLSGQALCFLIDFLFEKVVSVLYLPPKDGFSWIYGAYYPKTIYKRCTRCSKIHHTYYISRRVIGLKWARLRRMSVFEIILVAIGYLTMYVVLIAHASLGYGLSLATYTRFYYRSGKYRIALGATIIWALAVFWRR